MLRFRQRWGVPPLLIGRDSTKILPVTLWFRRPDLSHFFYCARSSDLFHLSRMADKEEKRKFVHSGDPNGVGKLGFATIRERAYVFLVSKRKDQDIEVRV